MNAAVRIVTGVLVAAMLTGQAGAQIPQGSGVGLAFVCPSQVAAGQPYECTVSGRNSRNELVGVELTLTMPYWGLFVSSERLGPVHEVEDSRDRRWTALLQPGEGFNGRVRLFARRDGGSMPLSHRMRSMVTPGGRIDYVDSDGEITYVPPRVAIGIGSGGFWIHPAMVITLALLAIGAAGAAVIVVRGRRRPRRPVGLSPVAPFARSATGRALSAWAVVIISLGFLTLFATLAWHDAYVLRSYREADCIVRDTTMRVSGSVSTGAGQRRRETSTYEPLVLLEYEVPGRGTQLAAGFGTGTAITRGGAQGAVARLSGISPGQRVLCWYDPAWPDEVVVERGFGGAYLFSVLPLLTLWISWRVLRR